MSFNKNYTRKIYNDTQYLLNIMSSIQRIQSVSISSSENTSEINIYDNYLRKIENRLQSYDYSVFPNSECVIKTICTFLQTYESSDEGKITVIHGDSVLTNILINEFDKIKFIDMRGKCGSTCTICGDWLYDWAKLYQSLIGYDGILMNKTVNQSYSLKMINCFETYFVKIYSQKDFDNMKMITNSLILSLIPLHNNEKCEMYFNLINI